ncbi:MAG: hypothetical protein ABIH03_01095, partial [Pseudomonadota bacterium]
MLRRAILATLALIFQALLFAPADAYAADARPTGARAPASVRKIASVEGITEYRLANGLKVLLFPDPTQDTITVNVTYLVGSRHEGYGESGM